jgi:hypothetical protein
MVALLAGCSQPPGSSNAAAELASQANEGIDYASWPAVTPQPIRVPERAFVLCRSSREMDRQQRERGPHFAPAVKVFANPIALATLRTTSAMPVGSMVVKEKWWNANDAEPSAYAAMVKREPGYDSENGDWEYVFVQLKGGRRVERGRIKSCIACHQGAAPHDYLYRTYLGFDPPDQKN